MSARSEPLEIRTSAGHISSELALPEQHPRATVVLCHGFPSGATRDPDDPGYPGLARDLAQLGFAAVTFSFRGCYDSAGNFSLSGWIEDLGAVLDAITGRTPQPLMVAGSSLGGAVALLVAADDDRIRCLATLAAPAVLDELGGEESADAFIVRARQIGVIKDVDFPHDPEAWAQDFRLLRPEDAAAKLAPTPVLVVHGTAADVVPGEHGERLAALTTSATKVILSGAGHQLRRDPMAVRVVFAWLASHGGLSSAARATAGT
jgi:uncharacterized protein